MIVWALHTHTTRLQLIPEFHRNRYLFIMGTSRAEHSAHEEINQILNSFAHFGVKLGLDSTHILLSHLQDPHHKTPIIHVAGTNGKGSVCAYISSIFTAAGYRVGRYISPHLVDWSERICINNHPIPALSLLTIVQSIATVIHTHQLEATQFEVITAAAWLYFADQQVDLAVIEVGLGGRLDATNVCDRPLASVITSIGRDHWQQLGDTLSDIASEKAGILKAGCPAIIGPLPPEAQSTIAHQAHTLNCPTQWVSPALPLSQDTLEYQLPTPQPQDPNSSSTHAVHAQTQAKAHPFTYTIGLQGDYQRANSALAIATSHTLQQQGWKITPAHIREGLAQAQWPGRLQWLHWNGKKLLIDGAHNAAAAHALRQYTDTLAQPIHWVIGMLATKDHEGVLGALLKGGDRLSLVPVPDSDSASPETLRQIAQACCPNLIDCHLHHDVVEALYQATLPMLKTNANMHSSPTRMVTSSVGNPSPSGTIVLCGSLYLLGYFLKQNHTLNA